MKNSWAKGKSVSFILVDEILDIFYKAELLELKQQVMSFCQVWAHTS